MENDQELILAIGNW